ncbi:antirestriction protein [Lachnospiraceae bacterium PH1-22]
MAEVKVYISNLHTYNEGNTKGAWFTLPVTYEEVAEKIGCEESDLILEEYAIHDYEAPYRISEYDTIAKLNEDYRYLEEVLEFIPNQVDVGIIIKQCYDSIEELFNEVEDITLYQVDSMEEVAGEIVEGNGILDAMGDWSGYFNYAMLARDLEINGMYVHGNAGIYEIQRG